MRKLLISTTALSVAFSPVGTFPSFAQTLAEDGSVIGQDGAVICTPTTEEPCNLEDITQALQTEAAAAAAAAQAEAEAAAQAAADAATEAKAAAEAEVAARAEAEAASQAEAEAAAEAEPEAAQAATDAAAAAQAAADAAAQEAAAAEAAAQAEAEVAAQAAADAEAAAQAEADANAAAEAAAAAAESEAVEETPAIEGAPGADEALVVEEEPTVEEAPEADEAPAIEEAPAVEEAPAGEEAAVTEETPAVDEAAETEEAPAVEEAPAAEEAPLAEEEPAVEEAPVIDEAPVTDEEPAVEEAPEAGAAPVTEEAPVTDEAAAVPTEESAPVDGSGEAAPAVDGAEAEVTLETDRNEAVEDASNLLPEASGDTTIQALGEGAIDPATGTPLDAEGAAAAAAALAEAEAELQVSETGEIVDPTAGLRVAEPREEAATEAVDAPVISETEVESLTQLLTTDPTAIDPDAVAAAAAVTERDPAEEGPVTLDPTTSDALLGAVTETITEGTVRTSAEEFEAAPVRRDDGRKSGLSNLEKAGLVVLGALVVGSIIKSNNETQEERRVVSNTGDRVVVLRPDGSYQLLKDDDTIIRQPGSTVRTETFRDGSTRTIVERTDGTQVVTIRDATGRVLRRATYDDRGRETVLIDDLQREEVVVVRDLPRPSSRIVISSMDNDAALKRELAVLEAERAGRKFSLRQIREIPQVRALAATIDVSPVTFATGSAAIPASEARNLADLGRVIQDLLDLNPGEVFLIEGHTDATGTAALNLALSDRRAESVALALTEYFDIPPENMVIQGYGERELLVDTQASEAANRRVEVRVVTPLMRTAELR